jgi:hypothetical protein
MVIGETNNFSEVRLLDLRKLFGAYLEKKNGSDAKQGVLTEDDVHLNDAGNRFVAEQMLYLFQF